MGCMPYFFPLSGWFSRFDVALQIPQPCFLSWHLTSKRFCSKGFGFSLSNFLGNQTSFVKNQPPTLRKTVPDFGKNLPQTLGKSVPDFGKIRHRFWGNEPPTLGKWATDFGEICHQLWGNELPTLGKSAADFGKSSHRLWENLSPILGKSATNFKEISHRFWENQSPILGKSVTDFGKDPSPTLGQSTEICTDFGEIRQRFWGNFDIETVLGFVLGTCMRCHKHKLIYVVPIEDENT